jgi:hypothetical protein
MTARRLARLAPILALAAAGCGSSGEDDRFELRTPAVQPSATATATAGAGGASGASGAARRTRKEPITRSERRVIRGWATTLRRGHVARAARYFAVPSVVANGFPPTKLTSRRQARQFNRILTCGARVVRFERGDHHFVITTFRIVDRAGPGAEPCPGGGLAATAFRIRRGHITRWLRLPDPPSGEGGGAVSPAGSAS